MKRALRFAALALVLSPLVVGGCGSEQIAPVDPLVHARHAAEGSKDGEVLGKWLLAELVAQGGEPAQALAEVHR